MNTQIALRRRARPVWLPGRFLRLSGLALLAVLALGWLWSWRPAADGGAAMQGVAANQLVHWRDAGHDWLLVVDPATRELVVYDANDGRPLERLGADDGMPEVRSIVQQGASLLVMGEQHPKVRRLTLPALQAVAVNSR